MLDQGRDQSPVVLDPDHRRVESESEAGCRVSRGRSAKGMARKAPSRPAGRQTKTVTQLDAFGKPKRMKRYRITEHAEQVALMQWMAWKYPAVEDMSYAIPNGGHRHKAVARKMKAEGGKAGVPDLCIAWPHNGKAGLYIELKATGTTASAVSKDQRGWISKLRNQGYAAEVAHGLDEAKSIVEEYLR